VMKAQNRPRRRARNAGCREEARRQPPAALQRAHYPGSKWTRHRSSTRRQSGVR
jgi:hypothetical protein